MDTKAQVRHTLETRLDEFERELDTIEARAAHRSAEARDRQHSQFRTLRERADATRARLREKDEADGRASDALFQELGQELNGMYASLADGPR